MSEWKRVKVLCYHPRIIWSLLNIKPFTIIKISSVISFLSSHGRSLAPKKHNHPSIHQSGKGETDWLQLQNIRTPPVGITLA